MIFLDGKQPDDNIVYPYMPPKRRHVGYTNPLVRIEVKQLSQNDSKIGIF